MEIIASKDRLGPLLLQFLISFKNTGANMEYVALLRA